MIAFDLETHLIQAGLLTPPIVCASFAWDTGDGAVNTVLHEPEQGLEALACFLDDPLSIFAGANIAYDWGCTLAVRPELLPLIWKAYEEGRVYDVLIAGTLDAIAGGRLHDKGLFARDGSVIQSGRYSLESATFDYLGRRNAKQNDKWRLSYALLEGTPIEEWPPEARQYPIDDVVNTLQVAKRQLEVCQNQHNLAAQAHAAFCMHLGSIWGMRLGTQRAAALKTSVDAEIERVRVFAKEQGFLKLTGKKVTKDMKSIRERVFQAYDGFPPSTDGGDISTSRETLEESEDPVLEEFAELSKWEKLRTYADELASLGDRPMSVETNPLLSTGRASYKGLIQLMPRKGGVRECCIARPGHALISVDYAAIEMSTLAQVHIWALGRSTLADAINADIDPHSLFAAGMTGVPYEDFLRRKKEPLESGLRFAAKAGNFGFPGMMGPVKFVIAQKKAGGKVCEWTHQDGKCGEAKLPYKIKTKKGRELSVSLCSRCVKEAEKLKMAYLRQWPEMKPYWFWVTQQLEANDGKLTQFQSHRIRGGCSAPAAANTLFQGLAADGAKAALVQVTKEQYLDTSSPLYGCRTPVFAHDELLIETPLERIHEAGYRLAEVMVDEMRKFVPDVKVKAEPAAMLRWDKGAETVLKEGKLAVWEREA